MTTDEATDRMLNTSLEACVAELTEAAYAVVLRHGAGILWLDLELAIWHALTDAASRCNRESL